MCWEYESEYGWCFDHLFFGDPNLSLIVLLEDEYSVDIIRRKEFVNRVFSLLSTMHEDGVIAPRRSKHEEIF